MHQSPNEKEIHNTKCPERICVEADTLFSFTIIAHFLFFAIFLNVFLWLKW